MSEPTRVEFSSDLYPTTRQPVAIVEYANALDGRWTRLLHADRVQVRQACAPEYGEASFDYAYGQITRAGEQTPDVFLPLSLGGKFVRITIPNEDAIGDGDDDPDLFRWYGIIEGNSKDLIGNMNDVPSGVQRFRAYGLLRLLDRVLIDSAMIRDANGEAKRVPSPRPFNLHRLDGWVFGLNRSVETTDGVYTFTPDPLLSAEWNAFEAIQYLLKFHAPQDGDGEPACNLAIRGPLGETEVDAGILSWFKIMAETSGRSLKQLLDQLIPRTRGVGYWVDYEEPTDIGADDETGRGTITINLFTFVNADLVLRTPTGEEVVLPENPNQIEWDFERDASVEEASVDELETVRYDKVIVEGDNITSTGTFALHLDTDAPIAREWDDIDVEYYKLACSLAVGYVGWDLAVKYQRNAEDRAKRENVFRSWRINPGWQQLLYDLVGDSPEHYYYVLPPFIDEEHQVDPLGDPEWRIDRQSFGVQPWSNQDARFLEYLTIPRDHPWLERPDYPLELPDDSHLGRCRGNHQYRWSQERNVWVLFAQSSCPGCGAVETPPREKAGTTPSNLGNILHSPCIPLETQDPDRGTPAVYEIDPKAFLENQQEFKSQDGFAKAFVFGNNFKEATDPAGRFWTRWDEVPFSGAESSLGATPTSYRLQFQPRPDWPGFFIVVDGAVQTMLGVDEWTPPDPRPPDWNSPAHTDPMHNPRMWGVAWRSLYVTATLDLGVPLRAVAKVGTVGRRVGTRTLRIYVQGARLDLVCPKTVIDIFDGVPMQLKDGFALRDDRKRLARIAEAAAAWYGVVRQQLRLTRRRLSVPRLTRLGTLVVRTGMYYSTEPINTPITAIEVDGEAGTVKWETGYVELDLAP